MKANWVMNCNSRSINKLRLIHIRCAQLQYNAIRINKNIINKSQQYCLMNHGTHGKWINYLLIPILIIRLSNTNIHHRIIIQNTLYHYITLNQYTNYVLLKPNKPTMLNFFGLHTNILIYKY